MLKAIFFTCLLIIVLIILNLSVGTPRTPSIPVRVGIPTITSTIPVVSPLISQLPQEVKAKTNDVWQRTTEGKTTWETLPSDSHMSTVSELNIAMNQYRASHSLSQLQTHSTLCSIAQSRANELLSVGHLDSHAGMGKYAHSQKDFNTIDEVLFGGVQPQSGVHIVEWGWDRSLTGHHEAISDPIWQYGCAGIAGYFAVFEFGKP